MKKILASGKLTSILLILLPLTSCHKLSTIPMSPETTPEKWLTLYPHVNMDLFGASFILAKPSSSAIVFSLAIITLVAGILFLLKRNNQQSRTWWGIALVLWGLGTVAAGTSYQALAWEIKCAGNTVCAWTSWFEVTYMILEVASINSMVMAVAHSLFSPAGISKARTYAGINMALYLTVALTGAFIPNWFMVSFELMLLFCIPGLTVLFVVSIRAYQNKKDPLNRSLIITWVSLFAVMVAYYSYLLSGIAEALWKSGTWFSANDVLHIGLILWMFYIMVVLSGKVKDYTEG